MSVLRSGRLSGDRTLGLGSSAIDTLAERTTRSKMPCCNSQGSRGSAKLGAQTTCLPSREMWRK
nr:hypothetical protein BDOA9_0201990 [Bradyrhizobium sp. DOA9]